LIGSLTSIARFEAAGSDSELLIATPCWIALVFVYDFTVRAQAVEGVLAPERAIIAVLHGGVPLGFDEETLPPQILTAVSSDSA